MEPVNIGTQKYTQVKAVDQPEFGANHHYVVTQNMPSPSPGKVLGEVKFQQGPIKEHGVNGVMNEDLLAMVIHRLECFQKTDFKCRENAIAITKLEEAVLWLRKRTMDREQRGVEGTHVV